MKHMRKALALILTVLLLTQIPVEVFGRIVSSQTSQIPVEEILSEDFLSDSTDDSEPEPSIVGEVTEKREENVKVFRLDDGSFLAAEYLVPVHYQNEAGEWVDYDNSLEIAANPSAPFSAPKAPSSSGEIPAQSDTAKYQVADTDAPFALSESAAAGNTAQIQNEGYTLSWGPQESQGSEIEIVDNEETLTGNDRFLVLPNLTQEAYYPSVYPNVDLQYMISSTGIKENYILKNRNAQKEFVISYQANGLTAVPIDEKTIDLQNNSGEVIYRILSPEMTDNSGSRSEDVFMTLLSQDGDTIQIRVTADTQWLDAADREYPVAIDPTITTTTSQSDVHTTFITSAMPGTNHSTKFELLVGRESTEYNICRTLVKLDMPSLKPGDMIVNAKLCLVMKNYQFYGSSTPSMQINAHKITESWNYSNVTWNNRPNYDSAVLDYNFVRQDDPKVTTQITNDHVKSFDITKAVKQWYEGTSPNYGILLKSSAESGSYMDTGVKAQFWPERYNDLSGAYPVALLTYRNNKGLEDYWTYTTASAGSAGTAYVNDYTGNLVFIHGDVATTGLLAPVTLEHVYNGYMAGIKYTDNYVTVGRGWKMSVQQTVRSSSKYGLSGSALSATPYAYEDGDGTVHFFYKKTENGKTKYLDEDGLGLELKIISGLNCTITDEKDNVLTFDARGNLSTIKDANGNAITISYQKDGDIYRITKITDGAGHVITVTQNDSTNHYLASLKDPAGRVTTYTYAVNDTWGTGCLTKITYPDGTKSQFQYDSDRALKKVIASDGTSLEFTYTSKAKGKRVSKIVEKGANGDTGQTILFDRSNFNNTVIRTSGVDGVINNNDDIVQTYQFDNFGRTVCVKSKKASGTDLGTSMYQYTSGSKNSSASNIKQLNRVKSEAGADNSTRNYLQNHSGESSGNWVSSYWINSAAEYTANRVSSQKLFGNYSLHVKVDETQNNGGGCYYQQIDGSKLTAGSTYTLSAYVKTSGLTRANSAAQGYGACLGARFVKNDGSISREYSNYITSSTSSSINKGWERLTLTFTVPQSTDYARFGLVIMNATGEAWFDGIQLEKAPGASNYNLLENSSLEDVDGNLPAGWYGTNLSSTDTTSTDAKADGSRSMKIVGESGFSKRISQQIVLSSDAKESDTYIAGAWAKANAVPESDVNNRLFAISVTIYYSNGSVVDKTQMAKFNPAVSDWQYTGMAFNLSNGISGDNLKPTKITYMLRYKGQANTVYFDRCQLVKDSYLAYTYDTDGKLIKTTENGDRSTVLNYNSDSDLTGFTDLEGKNYTYKYNDAHQVTEAKTPRGVKILTSYDGNGTATVSQISNSSGTMKIRTSRALTSASGSIKAGAYVAEDRDQHFNKTYYDYNLQSGQLKSVRNANNVTTTYSYKANTDLLSGVSSSGTTVNYGYDNSNSRLTSIAHNGFTYGLSYDTFGNLLKTTAGDYTLSTNTYGVYNGLLKQTKYGNGDTIDYSYSSFGSLLNTKKNGTTQYSWVYSNSGLPAYQTDYVNKQKHIYQYDLTGRYVQEDIIDTERSSEYDRLLYKVQYRYDKMDNVTASVRQAGGRSWTDSYTYNDDKQPLTSAVNSSRKIEYTYDSLGRLKSRSYTLDSPLKNDYIYLLSNRNEEGSELYRTTQLRYEFLGDTAYRYTYDNIGNIIKIEEGQRQGEGTDVTGLTEKVTYEYDALGQLSRENNRYLNATVVYAYDGGGNLTSRTIYPYTTGELGEATDTITYTYDSDWKDLLTGYDGQSITSDEIGNPVTYRDGMSMSWDGRQLTQLTQDGTTITYQYGSDGLRTSKTVNGEEYRYWYQDGQLVYEERGDSKQFYYSYDGYGHLSCIRYYHNGTGYVYYVQTNSRGDVEALYLGDGSLRVRYIYDSWGNTLSVQDGNGQEITSQNDIGNLNPFRYRGYYFDAETGLYYLQNRYYDPKTCRFINADTTDILEAKGDLYDKNLFAYCDNNPVARVDYGGEFWQLIVGAAAIGGLISGTYSAVTQYIETGEINWYVVGVNAASGAISGALSATNIGLSAAVGVNAALNVVTYTSEQLIRKEEITFEGIVTSAASGAVSGLIGGRGANAKSLETTWKAASKGITRETRRANAKYAAKRIVQYRAQKAAIKKDVAISIGRMILGPFGSTIVNKLIEKIKE